MAEKKKVILIGPAHPLRGGLATFNERLALEFLQKGYDITIFTFSLQYPGILFPGKTQFSSEPGPKGLDIRIAINSINPFNWYKVGNIIKKMKPDLVIIRYWLPFMAPVLGTLARLICKNGYTKVLALVDNMIPHEKRLGDKLLSAYFIRSVDAFISMSKSVLMDIEKFDQKKPKAFCPHPLYDTFGTPVPKGQAMNMLSLDPAYKYILFFGFIRHYKGLDLLIEAMAHIKISQLPLKLIVAGEFYTDSKPYLELINRLGLHDKIVMNTHFIPDSEVYKYFCAADLVVQPYRNATQSGVTQIAYYFNKPMIISNVGGLQEFVPDNKVGFVVTPDSESIATAIYTFYSENKEAEFSLNVASEKHKFSWNNMVETILSLYIKA